MNTYEISRTDLLNSNYCGITTHAEENNDTVSTMIVSPEATLAAILSELMKSEVQHD